MSEGYPVRVAVRWPDGSTEKIRVGTAYKEEDGFRLELGELSIDATPEQPASRSRRRAGPASARAAADESEAPTRLPNYGRSKGAPIHGASADDLEYYAYGARRSLADPNKARWHDRERALLAAIDQELERQRREERGEAEAGYGDEHAPM